MIRIRSVGQGRRLHGNTRKHFHDFLEYLRFTLGNYYAAKLIDNQHVLFGWYFAEALNEKLQNIVSRFWSVL